MISVGVVVPTLRGREVVLEQALDALSASVTSGYELTVTVPLGYASCGEAWNEGRQDVDGDYLYFMSDDVVLHPGWLEKCVEAADAGYMPAARQVLQDGTLEGCGSMGFGRFLPECDDWTPVRQTGLPFIRAEWWDVVGPFLPIHYACDDDWTWRALLHGVPCAYREGYSFTHLEERTASQDVRQHSQDHQLEFVKHAATLRFPSKSAWPGSAASKSGPLTLGSPS